MPAGALLDGCAGPWDVALEVEFGEERISGVFEGDGVKGVENGCAAEVEVAAGGLSGRRSLEVVERRRKPVGRSIDEDRRRVQF